MFDVVSVGNLGGVNTLVSFKKVAGKSRLILMRLS